jgi:hypothetical protein
MELNFTETISLDQDNKIKISAMKIFVLIDTEQPDAEAIGLLFFFDTNADGVRSPAFTKVSAGKRELGVGSPAFSKVSAGKLELGDGSADWLSDYLV